MQWPFKIPTAKADQPANIITYVEAISTVPTKTTTVCEEMFDDPWISLSDAKSLDYAEELGLEIASRGLQRMLGWTHVPNCCGGTKRGSFQG